MTIDKMFIGQQLCLKRMRRHLLSNKFVQRLTGIMPFELRPKKWIFVVGCYNSRTTLLDAMLQSHPNVSGLFREGVFLSDSLPFPEQYGWSRMWYKCADKIRMPLSEESGEKFAIRIRCQWAWCIKKSRDCVVERSISNAARIPFFHRFFDNAYFIYIVRNGYAVSEGIRRKGKPERWVIKIFQKVIRLRCVQNNEGQQMKWLHVIL